MLRPVIRDDFTDSGYDPDPDDFFSGNIPGLLGDAVSAVGDKLGEATKNPLATIANFAFGFVPGVGWVNSASNFFGGPNIGDLLFGNDDRDEPPSDPPGVPTGPPSDPTGSDYASANNPEDKEGDELDIAPRRRIPVTTTALVLFAPPLGTPASAARQHGKTTSECMHGFAKTTLTHTPVTKVWSLGCQARAFWTVAVGGKDLSTKLGI